jgi:fructoselysine-6-P-deglycase FrlB-like protein
MTNPKVRSLNPREVRGCSTLAHQPNLLALLLLLLYRRYTYTLFDSKGYHPDTSIYLEEVNPSY